MIDRRVLAILSVVLGLVRAGDAVAGQGRRGHVYPRTDRLEAAPGRAVLDLAHVPGVVYEAVLAVNLAGRILGLDFVRAVRRLEAVTVATVLVVPVEKRTLSYSNICRFFRTLTHQYKNNKFTYKRGRRM